MLHQPRKGYTVTIELPQQWVSSSYSSNGGNCLEWAPRDAAHTGTVPLRDSKDPGGPSLAVPAGAFAAFVAGVRSGALDG
ncbi:DUF397 domain-containing protein [Streptomyces lonarensis]|uniref:DUF397 domain-containing protein n=1 Tax=Streptomyces lonarensis TaxID=700599 RepID=A0A7X6D181_9ACTN|nr:DUF397 domain-containing protein [Streptomyces lonarensis]